MKIVKQGIQAIRQKTRHESKYLNLDSFEFISSFQLRHLDSERHQF